MLGNRAIGSRMQVANRHRFSYPGYSELLTGLPHDDVIDSNDNKRYPFLTVLEWLRQALAWPAPGVAAFGSGGTLHYLPGRREGAQPVHAA